MSRAHLISNGTIKPGPRSTLHDAISFERPDGSIGTNYGPTCHRSAAKTLALDKVGRQQAAKDIATYKLNPQAYQATEFLGSFALDAACMAVILAGHERVGDV